jgi:NAD(P)-dependent dehydrogenase (short-subunit alcohol dehydrogenase family)
MTDGVLAGRVAIVTGGASGIGRASAAALAGAGATVVVADLDETGARTVAEDIERDGGRATAMRVDVGDVEDCGRLVTATVAEFGGLHILHANAGIAMPFRGDAFTPDADPEVWDRVIRVNLSGVFYCCHHAIPAMVRSGGGSIITTGSSMSTLPLGGLDAYAASKGGVAMLTKSMAVGCGPLGVRVNAIGPGYVDTPMNGVILDVPELTAAFAAGHADGNLQTPEEIGDLVVFLASDASRSLNGALLTCDRGWTSFKRP